MTDYHPTIVEQRIPNDMMTRVEVWLLSRIFKDSGVDDDVWFFVDYEQPEWDIGIDDEFFLALKQSRTIDPLFCDEVEEASDGDFIKVEKLGGCDRIFQQIIRRRKGEIPYVRVQGSANLDWLIFGRFGGYATIITADHIEGMSTWKWLEERLVQLGFPVPEPEYRRPILNRRPTAAEHLASDLRQIADVFEQGHFNFDKWEALIKSHNARKRAAEFVNSRAAMSGDGKCRVAAPKLPRPSSYLPSRENARTNQFINEWFDRMEARLKVSPDNMDPAEVLRITASDIESGTVAFDEGDNVLSALSYLLLLGFQKAVDSAFFLEANHYQINTTNTHGTEPD